MSDVTVSNPSARLSEMHETRSCPACKARMRLVGVEPACSPDERADIYTYECVLCGDVCAETVRRT